MALADVVLHEAGHTYGLYHVDTLQGGVLYPESMGLRYSTNNQSEWLADTRFMNQSFDEYSTTAAGGVPRTRTRAMLRQFPGEHGGPGLQGAGAEVGVPANGSRTRRNSSWAGCWDHMITTTTTWP